MTGRTQSDLGILRVRPKLKKIARIDYITDGTPLNTIVVATLDDGTQIEIGDTIQSLDQEANSPVCRVMIVAQSPIRDHDVTVTV